MDTGTFDFDGPLRAAREAQALGARLRSMPRYLGEYEGRDANRVVTAVVGPTGALERVEVADSWRTRLDPVDFPAAVAAAAAAAEEAHSEAYGDALTRAFDSPGSASADDAAFRTLGLDPSELFTSDLDLAMDRLRRLAALADEAVAAADAAARTENPGPPGDALGIGERGMVELRLHPGGGLAGCEIDLSWLGRCPHWMLADELATALAGAHRSHEAARAEGMLR
ncbi:hypothetical protein [Tenggerimyces flavus]|uniref:DUF2470 domain-containing protein n=1 Tax=Tenggerimyces flavus TaxID=1708749 RepID=A0ABV7YQN8_9ACTN|nr:hypothetical protein [Tenggerimyces flavus]MBM7790396.1 hypothetical protein [Tenggerimyces flavus]